MKKTIICAVILSLIIPLAACGKTKMTTHKELQPAQSVTDTNGEVYENNALLIGFIFPPEYVGKYTIIQHEGGGFAVLHTATFERFGYADGHEPFGLLFTIERWHISFGEDVIHRFTEAAVFLFRTDEDFYYLRRPNTAIHDKSTPETWQSTEYKLLSSDDMINRIMASAYLTAQTALAE